MGDWEFSFRGVCLFCQRWFWLTTEGPKEDFALHRDMQWWADCVFCFGKQCVAFRHTGGLNLKFAREQREKQREDVCEPSCLVEEPQA